MTSDESIYRGVTEVGKEIRIVSTVHYGIVGGQKPTVMSPKNQTNKNYSLRNMLTQAPYLYYVSISQTMG